MKAILLFLIALVAVACGGDLSTSQTESAKLKGGGQQPPPPSMSLNEVLAKGQYTGNGGTLAISIGWQPDFVFVGSMKSSGAAGTKYILSTKMSTMSGANAGRFRGDANAAYAATGLTLTADGFQVAAADTNTSGIQHKWLAVKAGAHLDVGTYTGNGSTSPGQTITTGRQPARLIIVGQNGIQIHKALTQSGDTAIRVETSSVATPAAPNGCAINADGFTVKGTGGNDNAIVHHYLALYEVVGATRHNRAETHPTQGGTSPLVIPTAEQFFFALHARGIGGGQTGASVSYAGGQGDWNEGFFIFQSSGSTHGGTAPLGIEFNAADVTLDAIGASWWVGPLAGGTVHDTWMIH